MVHAQIAAIATSDHTVDEHREEEIDCMAGNIVPGVGFTIYAKARNFPLYGAWTVTYTRI